MLSLVKETEPSSRTPIGAGESPNGKSWKRSRRPVMSKGRLVKKLYYAFFLVHKGGTGVLLRQFFSRVYSTSTYVWLAKDLDPAKAPGAARTSFSLQPASPEAFQGISARLNEERGQDVFEILRRVSFYERGFDACYLALTDSGDVCHVAWLLSASHNDLIRSQYPPGTDCLREDDVLVENIFTFPRYRGKGIMLSVIQQLEDLARKQGFRRVVAYVDTTNTPSLAGFNRAGYNPCGEEKEKRRFFRIRRTGKNGQ
jgi:GNAT superfamily N-acetyltransferase